MAVSIIAIFIFSFSTFMPTIAIQTLIAETCTNISWTDPNINCNYCIAALESMPPPKHKNHLISSQDSSYYSKKSLKYLAHTSIEITRKNATNTRRHIKQLMKSPIVKNGDVYVKTCLEDCLELYTDAARMLKMSRKYVSKGKFDDANIWVSSVVDSAETCDEGFQEKEGINNLMAKRDGDLFQLSVISLAIINKLVWNIIVVLMCFVK